MKTAMTLLFAACIASEALAFNEPDGIQLLKFGQDVRKALPKCDTLTMEEKMEKACWRQHDIWVADESKLAVQNIRVGETSLKMEVEQIDDKLEKISATFPGVRFTDFAAAMQTRFGTPTSSKSITYQNNLGAKFEYPRYEWIGKKIHITVEQAPLSSRDTLGMLTYVTTQYLKSHSLDNAQKVKKAAKDLE